jgi:hypothetical protein
MYSEIPHFLHFLLNRKLSTENESRMWFNPQQLETPALLKIKKYNTHKIEMEVAACCLDIMVHTGKDTIFACPADFLDVIRNAGLKTDITQVRNILKDVWGLRSEKNSDYTFYRIGTDGELFPMKRKGRSFEINRRDIDEILL